MNLCKESFIKSASTKSKLLSMGAGILLGGMGGAYVGKKSGKDQGYNHGFADGARKVLADNPSIQEYGTAIPNKYPKNRE